MDAIVLIDHGSRRAEANFTLECVGRLVAQRVGPSVIVRVAHMELASPSIEEAVADCVRNGARRIVAHPYMLAPGRHSVEDIPRLVKEAAQAHPGLEWEVTAPLGVHPLLAEVVLDRCGVAERPGDLRLTAEPCPGEIRACPNPWCAEEG